MPSPRTVAVAGGAGFLGSHLCDRLLERGDEVVCLDDLSTGSLANVGHLGNHPRFHFVRHDIVEGRLDDVAPQRFDAIFHLASPAAPPAYLERPIETLRAGSEGTRHLLERAERDGSRFVLASTSEVYGDAQIHPQPESYWGHVNPVGERSVYDEAKRYAEAITMAYQRVGAVDVGIARIFNTYGPRMRPDDGRVVVNFIHQALMCQPLTLYGDGQQTRSFCYVDDQVRGLLALLDSTTSGPVNLGNPEETSMAELATLVCQLTDRAVHLTRRPLPADDPRRRRPDISRAKSVLGWQPEVPLVEGLRRTIDWYRQMMPGDASDASDHDH